MREVAGLLGRAVRCDFFFLARRGHLSRFDVRYPLHKQQETKIICFLFPVPLLSCQIQTKLSCLLCCSVVLSITNSDHDRYRTKVRRKTIRRVILQPPPLPPLPPKERAKERVRGCVSVTSRAFHVQRSAHRTASHVFLTHSADHGF